MSRLALVLILGGCNWVFGLDTTAAIQNDAGFGSGACDPLPFDQNRYLALTANLFDPNDWATARVACQERGYDLAVIDDNDSAEIGNELDGAALPFWFGASYTGAAWTALDACDPLLQWAPNEPGAAAAGDCVAQTTNGMVSDSCTQTQDHGAAFSALCEAGRPDATCKGYELERDYMLLSATVAAPVTRDDGAMECALLGAGWHIVEIDSSDELSYLLTHEASGLASFWIGATRTATSWTSPTGCPQVFEWSPDFPEEYSCALYQGGMQDQDCANQVVLAAVICELNQ